MAKTILAIILLSGGAGACSSPAPPAHRTGPVAPTTGPVPTSEPTTTTEAPATTTSVAPEPVEEEPTTVPTTRARSAPTTRPYVAPTTVYVGPVAGGDGGWVIPSSIVGCETGGTYRWDSENASGAGGPYQLMPEHFDGESALDQSREAQHAKAAELWNGGVNTRSGLGPQNWEACL